MAEMKYSEKKDVYYGFVTFRFLNIDFKHGTSKPLHFDHIILVTKKRYEKEQDKRKIDSEFWLEIFEDFRKDDSAVTITKVSKIDQLK